MIPVIGGPGEPGGDSRLLREQDVNFGYPADENVASPSRHDRADGYSENHKQRAGRG